MEFEEQLRDTRKNHTSLTRADIPIPEPSVEGTAKSASALLKEFVDLKEDTEGFWQRWIQDDPKKVIQVIEAYGDRRPEEKAYADVLADTVRVTAKIDLVEAAERLAHPEELLAAERWQEQQKEAWDWISKNTPMNGPEDARMFAESLDDLAEVSASDQMSRDGSMKGLENEADTVGFGREQNASISTSDPSMETAKASSVTTQKKDRMKVAIGRGLQAMGGHTDASMMARGVGAGALHLAGSMVGLGDKTQGVVDRNREVIREMQQSRMPSLEDALDALGADTRGLGIQR